MQRWLKWLLIPLVFILLVGGIQGYVWYTIKTDADSMITSLRPFAKIEYGDISASFLGQEVEFNHVTIQPNSYKEKIVIEHVSLASTSRAFIFTAHEQFSTGILEDPVSLIFSGLRYDINADYAENLVLLSPGSQIKSLDTLLCGDVTSINQSALQAMGYRFLQGDFYLELESSANHKLMKIRSAAEFSQFMKGEVSLWLALQQGGGLRRDNLAKTSIQMFAMTVSDLGYNQRWKRFCAQQAGDSVEEYLTHYRTALAASLGSLASEHDNQRLLDIFEGARSNNSIVDVRWEPALPQEIQVLASPNERSSVFSSTEFAVQINGKILELLDDEWLKLRQLFGGNVRRAALAMVENKQAIVEEQKEVNPLMEEIIPGVVPIRLPEVQKSFVDTPVDDLINYVGHSVKLRTFFGRNIEGTLVEVTNGAISIRHQVEQGSATFPVSKDKIDLIEVYR